ncbi:crossover junction endodeoxyribonuclease RuvC [Candidatus Bipolaricaulota bacterium]|nr:crossover junction endodeoxyribonuclease RuvC [Candidatus Bipolaricaulota bacterium]
MAGWGGVVEQVGARVLGVDPGLSATGYAVVEARGRRFSVLAAGTIRTQPGTGLPERLGHIHDALVQTIATYEPQAVAVEEVFLARNAPSAMGTAEVIGIVKLLARGRELRAFPPRQVKKWICGNGSAPKEQMLAMVKALVSGDGEAMAKWSDHAGDAVAIALCAFFAGGR